MNLKEAFRYQNKLQSFLDEAQSILDRDANVTRVENTYLRHKVMAEAEDETLLCTMYFSNENAPLYAEIAEDGKIIAFAEFTDFTFGDILSSDTQAGSD